MESGGKGVSCAPELRYCRLQCSPAGVCGGGPGEVSLQPPHLTVTQQEARGPFLENRSF